MRGQIRSKVLAVATLCLLFDMAGLAQQLASLGPSAAEGCLEAVSQASGDSSGESLCQTFTENQLGIESALVLGPERSLHDALKWFEKAAREGYAPAQVNLAVLYLNGWGVARNYGAALYWLTAAAKQGNTRAHSNLGLLYLNGWGVRRDYHEAATQFRLAAEGGETGAMVDLGFLSDGGLGVSRDPQEAARWYRLAAQRGDALGQNNLADLYLRGEGVPQSDALARDWFEKAASQGNTGARIKLGFLYANGRGVQRDAAQAYALIFAAELAGDSRGHEYLVALEKQLNADELAGAKEKARSMLITGGPAKTEIAFLR